MGRDEILKTLEQSRETILGFGVRSLALFGSAQILARRCGPPFRLSPRRTTLTSSISSAIIPMKSSSLKRSVSMPSFRVSRIAPIWRRFWVTAIMESHSSATIAVSSRWKPATSVLTILGFSWNGATKQRKADFCQPILTYFSFLSAHSRPCNLLPLLQLVVVQDADAAKHLMLCLHGGTICKILTP